MKTIILLFFSITFSLTSLSAQTDTLYYYYNKNWHECAPDTAFYYGKLFKDGAFWHKKDYWVGTRLLQMDARATDSLLEHRVGECYYYYPSGRMAYTDEYLNGKIHTTTHYYDYETGGKKAYAGFDTSGEIILQKGWDSTGKEIAGYIFQKPAQFPGGAKAWVSYLKNNLRKEIPAHNKAPLGKYLVIVAFTVGKDGTVYNAQAENDPGYGTKEEALRVIKNSPKWTPAIFYNQLSDYSQRQKITFEVTEDTVTYDTIYVVKKEAALWNRKLYDKKTHHLLANEYYKEETLQTKQGLFTYYDQLGRPNVKVQFNEKGTPLWMRALYPNGKTYIYITYAPDGSISVQKAWKTNGAPIPGFIAQRKADFPGGSAAWKGYLASNLKAETPRLKGAPVGHYSVMVLFTIDATGYVTEVHAENDPGYGTAPEAERVIRESPVWKPAILYNQRVPYRQKQMISFEVATEASEPVL